jgi:hypothetical protein
MSINSCGINGLASGLRVEGLGSEGSVNFVDLVAVVCAVAFFVVAGFGFAFACAIGFDLCAVAFFATGFFFFFFFATGFFAICFFVTGFFVVAFFATGFVFAMIFLLLPHERLIY